MKLLFQVVAIFMFSTIALAQEDSYTLDQDNDNNLASIMVSTEKYCTSWPAGVTRCLYRSTFQVMGEDVRHVVECSKPERDIKLSGTFGTSFSEGEIRGLKNGEILRYESDIHIFLKGSCLMLLDENRDILIRKIVD